MSLSILITYFWAFWGIVENSHEGWYCESLLSNLGLMFAQYLSPLTFIIAGIGPVVRIFQRIDDGNIQAQLVHGNGWISPGLLMGRAVRTGASSCARLRKRH